MPDSVELPVSSEGPDDPDGTQPLALPSEDLSFDHAQPILDAPDFFEQFSETGRSGDEIMSIGEWPLPLITAESLSMNI